MLLGLNLVGHQLELHGIASPNLSEGGFEMLKGAPPVWASIEIDKLHFRQPILVCRLFHVFQGMGSCVLGDGRPEVPVIGSRYSGSPERIAMQYRPK
jgi:hypothetical protein